MGHGQSCKACHQAPLSPAKRPVETEYLEINRPFLFYDIRTSFIALMSFAELEKNLKEFPRFECHIDVIHVQVDVQRRFRASSSALAPTFALLPTVLPLLRPRCKIEWCIRVCRSGWQPWRFDEPSQGQSPCLMCRRLHLEHDTPYRDGLLR